MDKKNKIYIVLLVSLLLAIIFYEYSKPTPINWFPSYAKKDKIPYGTYVLRSELPKLFPNNSISDITIPPFEFLQDDDLKGTYIFINDKVSFDDAEFEFMMQFVEKGNDVFISSKGFVIDTLKIETKRLLTSNVDERPFFKMLNKNFPPKEYTFDRTFNNYVFTSIDTLNTTILSKTGYLSDDGERTDEGANFVKLKYGEGNFYLHTFPEVFTNYAILKDEGHQHAAAILSYLEKDGELFWDEYYKTGKSKITSPMHYLLSTPSLKWAYYLMLIGVVFFVVFEGRRKQRFIPIIEPLKNQTLMFTRTIANMYYENSDHKNIAEHKISYLYDFIRLKLRIPTNRKDKTFYAFVASRSGNSIDQINLMFDYCNRIHLKNSITKEELLALNGLIEKFKQSIK